MVQRIRKEDLSRKGGKDPCNTRGAVGARTIPKNLAEKLALNEVKAGAGRRIMEGMIKNSRYPENTWAKIQHVHGHPDGTKTVIHYWENLNTGAREGFKFID